MTVTPKGTPWGDCEDDAASFPVIDSYERVAFSARACDSPLPDLFRIAADWMDDEGIHTSQVRSVNLHFWPCIEADGVPSEDTLELWVDPGPGDWESVVMRARRSRAEAERP